MSQGVGDGSWEERIAQDRNPRWEKMGVDRAEKGRWCGVEEQGGSHVRWNFLQGQWVDELREKHPVASVAPGGFTAKAEKMIEIGSLETESIWGVGTGQMGESALGLWHWAETVHRQLDPWIWMSEEGFRLERDN